LQKAQLQGEAAFRSNLQLHQPNARRDLRLKGVVGQFSDFTASSDRQKQQGARRQAYYEERAHVEKHFGVEYDARADAFATQTILVERKTSCRRGETARISANVLLANLLPY